MLTIIGGSCQKYHFCCNKSFVATNMCLSWQNTHLLQQNVFCHDKSMFACCDKTFVTTKWCLSWKIFLSQHVFVMTKVLSWKEYFCCNKRHVLLWQTHVCHNKSKLVATKVLLQQKYVCRDKKFCCDKHTFVTTKDVFVMTKLLFEHTPSTTFQHLPPNSAGIGYATERACFISVHLSTDAVSALQKVWVLIRLQKQHSGEACT